MMTASGFLTQRRRSPVSLGAAFAIQGVIIAGLVTMAPKIVPGIREDPTSIPVIRLTDPITPPPVIDPPPKPVVDPPISRIETVTPVIPTQPTFVLPPTPVTPIIDGPIVGTGTIITSTVTQPIKAIPVFKQAEVDSRFARALQPEYPGQMRRQGTEGQATVRVMIGTDGRVKAVELVSADHPSFFQATERQALDRWRFKPATRDGVAVESWRQMTVRFRMDD